MIFPPEEKEHGLPLVRRLEYLLDEGRRLIGLGLGVDPQVVPPLELGGLVQ